MTENYFWSSPSPADLGTPELKAFASFPVRLKAGSIARPVRGWTDILSSHRPPSPPSHHPPVGPTGALGQWTRCQAAGTLPGTRCGASCRRSPPARSEWCWPVARACQGSRCWRSRLQRRRLSRQSRGCGTGAPWPTWACGTSSVSAPCSSTSTSCRCWRGSPACWVKKTRILHFFLLDHTSVSASFYLLNHKVCMCFQSTPWVLRLTSVFSGMRNNFQKQMNEKSCLCLKYPLLSTGAIQQQILRTNLLSIHPDCFFSGHLIHEITLSCDHVNHTYVQRCFPLLILLWLSKVNVNIWSPLQF